MFVWWGVRECVSVRGGVRESVWVSVCIRFSWTDYPCRKKIIQASGWTKQNMMEYSFNPWEKGWKGVTRGAKKGFSKGSNGIGGGLKGLESGTFFLVIIILSTINLTFSYLFKSHCSTNYGIKSAKFSKHHKKKTSLPPPEIVALIVPGWEAGKLGFCVNSRWRWITSEMMWFNNNVEPEEPKEPKEPEEPKESEEPKE